METDNDYDVAEDYLDRAKLVAYTEVMAWDRVGEQRQIKQNIKRYVAQLKSCENAKFAHLELEGGNEFEFKFDLDECDPGMMEANRRLIATEAKKLWKARRRENRKK